jgi:hypothetical protein
VRSIRGAFDNAKAKRKCHNGGIAAWQDKKKRVFLVSIIILINNSKLQIQESNFGRKEGRIQYTSAHMEADGEEDPIIYTEGHGVLTKVNKWKGKAAACASVSEEAGCYPLGDE